MVGEAGAGTTIVEETERSIADDNAATSPYCFELFWHSSYCINKNDESSIAFSVISCSSRAAQNGRLAVIHVVDHAQQN